MQYRTVLTAVAKGDMGENVLDPVIAFAAAHGAHLEALCFGVDHAYPAYHYGVASLQLMQEAQERAREEALAVRKEVSAAIDQAGLDGTARAVVAGISGVGDVLADRGRLADIAVLTQQPDEDRPRLHEMIIEAALFAARLPVLLIPRSGEVVPHPRRIVVGWDDGPEALAAIRAALPLLQKADAVDVVVVDPPHHHAGDRPEPGHDVALMLSRHGVPVEVVILARTLPRISDMLVQRVADSSADLLVMGAYGHPRFQQTVFGGTTRRMLSDTPVPLLLAR